jgi:hypothetical protein
MARCRGIIIIIIIIIIQTYMPDTYVQLQQKCEQRRALTAADSRNFMTQSRKGRNSLKYHEGGPTKPARYRGSSNTMRV